MSHEISLPELRFSWDRNSKSREPLTILVPPHDRHPVESSRFSPESPPSPSRTHSTLVNLGTIRSPTRDVEAGTMPTTPHTARSNLRDRFTRLFFDVRTIGRGREPDIVPMQPPQLPAWPPLHIEKRHCCEHCTCHRDRRKKRKRDRILIAILIILLLYLFGNVVFLNVRTLNSTGTSSRSAPNTSTTTTLSAAAQQCLSEYNINAPANASSYPCSTCFPILQGVPSDFSDGNPQDAQQIENAIQFCSLRSIFDLANSNGQSGLTTGGWVKNVLFCSWSGVSCDGSGRVSSLQLTFPEVPATLSSEIGGLSGLQSLQVIGDTNVPAGSLPSSINSLTALMTLGLESTAITALPDNLFTSLSKVTTLTLVKNAQMGSDLPSSLTDLSLQNL
ncbi:hypothetical protein AcW1_003443 [Taiwanofungus camphoratus]|nr:hypothetical protein AcV5_002097 [Antrodia cinnamomea]KAI0941587.1 hypothetical protein AcW1_003443 [Antrodia cinnamomea]